MQGSSSATAIAIAKEKPNKSPLATQTLFATTTPNSTNRKLHPSEEQLKKEKQQRPTDTKETKTTLTISILPIAIQNNDSVFEKMEKELSKSLDPEIRLMIQPFNTILEAQNFFRKNHIDTEELRIYLLDKTLYYDSINRNYFSTQLPNIRKYVVLYSQNNSCWPCCCCCEAKPTISNPIDPKDNNFAKNEIIRAFLENEDNEFNTNNISTIITSLMKHFEHEKERKKENSNTILRT
jgi:hypothetical protein